MSGPGFGQNQSNNSGYSADVSSESSLSKLSNSSCLKGENVKFDSTSSSFLENVNSYCGVAQGSPESVELEEFKSTKSWFLENVNAYSQSQDVSMVSGDENAQQKLVVVEPLVPLVEDMSGVSENGASIGHDVKELPIEDQNVCENPAQPKLVLVEKCPTTSYLKSVKVQLSPNLFFVEKCPKTPLLEVCEDPAQPKLVFVEECPKTPLNDGSNLSRIGKRKIPQSPPNSPQNHQIIDVSVEKMEKLSLNDELCCQSRLKTRRTSEPEQGEPIDKAEMIGIGPETRENVPKRW